MHTGNGWETPRVGGACETDGPPCTICGSHPRVGSYATGLLVTGYSPGVVMLGLGVSPVLAINLLPFQFSDPAIFAIHACDIMGDSSTTQHERKDNDAPSLLTWSFTRAA